MGYSVCMGVQGGTEGRDVVDETVMYSPSAEYYIPMEFAPDSYVMQRLLVSFIRGVQVGYP